jgi:hypothetical protein
VRSNDADLVKQTALQQFASALQEAQRLAVQLEKDQASQKCRKLKTYQGDSRTTHYRREKAWKALASKGFLNIGSFLELKQKERHEWERSECKRECGCRSPSHSGWSNPCKAPTIADKTIPEGHIVDEGGLDEVSLIPGPVNHMQRRGGDTSDSGESHDLSNIDNVEVPTQVLWIFVDLAQLHAHNTSVL